MACPIEGCLTFQRLGEGFFVKEFFFRGQILKIQPQGSFDLNGLINASTKYFKKGLKSMHLSQKINVRYEL